ncbi:DUF255 domain-containing protein [Glaciecola sp. KUL10]|uniref:DUF255 domain-containing protein n=1 Tax=Glaciecola sp. (strain KUL10) TaxID=2161813 RepID=UPI000D829359|nr:DUF255 domain-containing protein [Glaciecola sp. KUL10]GBL03868.1 thiol:disulfide interchange protein [Glaciecola sp. KUL10]
MAFLFVNLKSVLTFSFQSLFYRFFIVLSFTLCIASANANDWQDINWQNYEDARASGMDKPVFVFAELHFCGACKKMKEEVFNQSEIIELINQEFKPVNMKSFGLFPNKLSDLKDERGEALSLLGSPALVVVYKNQYKLVYGFQNKAQLTKLLTESLLAIESAS